MLDTGAPGIQVVNGKLGREPWPSGMVVTLGFFGEGKIAAAETLTIGLRSHASRLSFTDDENDPNTVIYAGLSPYFAFDVLYDPSKGEIGLKPRLAAPTRQPACCQKTRAPCCNSCSA